MSTASWLLILLFVAVTVGTCMYHFGHAIGRLAEYDAHKARVLAKAKHPSNHLRIVEE
jgi:hypothetical protein